MLTEMDHNVGEMLDAVDRLGIRDNTIVIFASDNGPEFIKPWDGWGPWRGQYFTAWEGGIRVPFMIRWPGKIPEDGASQELLVRPRTDWHKRGQEWRAHKESCVSERLCG
jgi:arylsulfatase A-like enzyme